MLKEYQSPVLHFHPLFHSSLSLFSLSNLYIIHFLSPFLSSPPTCFCPIIFPIFLSLLPSLHNSLSPFVDCFLSSCPFLTSSPSNLFSHPFSPLASSPHFPLLSYILLLSEETFILPRPLCSPLPPTLYIFLSLLHAISTFSTPLFYSLLSLILPFSSLRIQSFVHYLYYKQG